MAPLQWPVMMPPDFSFSMEHLHYASCLKVAVGVVIKTERGLFSEDRKTKMVDPLYSLLSRLVVDWLLCFACVSRRLDETFVDEFSPEREGKINKMENVSIGCCRVNNPFAKER